MTARTLCKREGNTVVEPVKAWTGKDTMEVAALLKLEYDAARIKPQSVFVDVIGIGAGVVDRCREMGMPAVGANVAETPSVQDRHNRLRDELWFKRPRMFRIVFLDKPARFRDHSPRRIRASAPGASADRPS